MTRLLLAAAFLAAAFAAWSWHPRTDVPGWYVETCAEVAVC